MTRIHRDIKRALERMFGEASVRFEKGSKHDWVVVTLPSGERAEVTFAGSPSNLDVTVKNVVKDIRRAFQAPRPAGAEGRNRYA